MMKILNRAKAIDGTGGYIVSQSIKFENEKMFLYSIPFRQWVECDESTRSINLDDMLDSQGNKIFASLSEDGKGGDITNKGICLYESKYNQFRIITNLKTRTWLEITRKDLDSYPIKAIGIQE